MQHSEIRSKNELTKIFLHSNELIPTVTVYKVNNTPTISNIPGPYTVNNITTDYYTCDITTPNEDCYLCIKFGTKPIFIRVGNPTLYFLYYGINISQTIPYRQRLASNGSIHSSGNLSELNYGFYYCSPSTTDLSIIEIKDGATTGWMDHLLKLPYTSSTSSGQIEIEPNIWQLIAIPIEFGYYNIPTSSLIHDSITQAKIKNYVLDQLEDKYCPPATDISDLIEVANAYFGDNNFFYNFVPTITPTSSVHNFPLTYTDNTTGTYKEVTGFWIKSVHTANMYVDWG